MEKKVSLHQHALNDGTQQQIMQQTLQQNATKYIIHK